MREAEDRFPVEDVELTHILVVSDLGRIRAFYKDVLGATVYREYGDTSCVLRFGGGWLLLVTGGGRRRTSLAWPSSLPKTPRW